MVGLTLICALGIGGWEVTNGFGTSHQQDCVSAVVGSATGGGSVRACGPRARSWCKTESTASGPLASAIQKACRKAGYSA